MVRFQHPDFPAREGVELVQVCVTIDLFDAQSSEELSFDLITMDGPKAGI